MSFLRWWVLLSNEWPRICSAVRAIPLTAVAIAYMIVLPQREAEPGNSACNVPGKLAVAGNRTLH